MLVSYYCGICQLAYQKAAVEEHECGIGDLIPVWCCAICCQVTIRGKIREKYGLDGSCPVDCLVSLFCGLCAISQQTRQLDMKGQKPAGCFMED